jgi:hypothetical protein
LTDPKLEILTLAKINKELEHEIMMKISQALERENVVDNCHFPDGRQVSDVQN